MQDTRSNPGPGKYPEKEMANGILAWEIPMDRGAWGHKETTQQLTI